jgi:hypothetical protein
MRTLSTTFLASLALALLGGAALAGDTATSGAKILGSEDMGDECCNDGGGRHGLFGHHGGHGGCLHHRNRDDRNPYYNCGCNGSYKFPVPPLYTYHWLGQFSHQHMTDYHSPWRFPPLRPYIDEVPPGPIVPALPISPEPGAIPAGPRETAPRGPAEDFGALLPTSAAFPVKLPAGEVYESMSAKMERLGG